MLLSSELPFGLGEGESFLLGMVVSFIVLVVYIPVADRLNMIDKPNQRSSHTVPIVLGGGIVFPLILVLGSVLMPNTYGWFILGMVLLAIVSFIDDGYSLPSLLRLSVHLIAVVSMLVSNSVWSHGVLLFAVALILSIGWINTFNFMDGINGITALYSLSIMLACYIAYELWGQNLNVYSFAKWLLILGMSAVLAFSFFNVRVRARCFAGDVGSVSLALFLAFVVVPLTLFVNASFIGFFLLYGLDSVLTIFHRIKKKENILEAHRSHLYQYLANEMKWGHLRVSFLYFFIQVIISSVLIYLAYNEINPLLSFSLVFVPMVLIYLFARVSVLKKINPKNL
jgi:UDP-GlcNAc:undecaprenyl-phosphate GlcNAc-1-phosphate transferase